MITHRVRARKVCVTSVTVLVTSLAITVLKNVSVSIVIIENVIIACNLTCVVCSRNCSLTEMHNGLFLIVNATIITAEEDAQSLPRSFLIVNSSRCKH